MPIPAGPNPVDPSPIDPGAAASKRLWWDLPAFTWGFAEGTFFFLVPDIWLSYLTLSSPKRAFAASVPALLGALAGGAATYTWGRRLPAQESRRLLASLPAISTSMVDTVETELARGLPAMVLGPLRGRPYKIYARTAGVRGDGMLPFLLWSIPARLPRFLLVTGGAALAVRGGRRILGNRPRLEKLIFTAAWTAFYAWFFSTVGREGSER